MTKKAQIHNVLLKVDPKTKMVANAPMPHGCAFISEDACMLPGASRNVASGGLRTLQAAKPSFIYLDVGVWAGTEYDFGLICGRNVWLCRFTIDKGHAAIPLEAWCPSYSERPLPLKIFEEEIAYTNKLGFQLDTYAHVPKAQGCEPRSDILYLVLPDMHLPAIPHNKEFADKTYSRITTIYRDDKIVYRKEYKPVIERDQVARYAAFRQAKDADIFGKAGDALYTFLDFVTTMLLDKLDRKLKVVHAGDMYELWQGMGEWNSYFDDDPTGLVLEKDALEHLKERIQGIETQHRRLFAQFKYLETLDAIVYLYGNHDVYLVDKLRAKEHKWDKALGDRLPRRTHLYEGTIAFEHGHRMDSYNVDGDWRGPFITELVYWEPWLRAFDPDRREMYHTQTAIDVYYHNYLLDRPISVFVMAHTHAGDLKQIRMSALGKDDIRKNQCFTCKNK